MIPTVPVNASPSEYEALNLAVTHLVSKMQDQNPEFYREMEEKLPDLEKVLNKWVIEGRPDTYIKPLRQGISEIRNPYPFENLKDKYRIFYDNVKLNLGIV